MIIFAFGCVKIERSLTTTQRVYPITASNQLQLNINTASPIELENLPGIGKVMAERIVAHREQYGPFRRTEHLMMVRGISDKTFRELQSLVTVGNVAPQPR